MFLSTGFYLSYPKIYRPRYKINIHNLNRKIQKSKAFGKVNGLCHAKSCLTNLAKMSICSLDLLLSQQVHVKEQARLIRLFFQTDQNQKQLSMLCEKRKVILTLPVKELH